jgi:endonuclease G
MKTLILISIILCTQLQSKPIFFEPKECDMMLTNSIQETCYSFKFKGPLWTKYTLYSNKVDKTNIKKRPSFKQDHLIPEQYRSKSSDYKKSKYDRGHLRSDASTDYYESELKKAYLMSNIVPQRPKMNRYIWIKSEKYEREMARIHGTIFVKIFIYYGDKTIKNGVGIPSSFIKQIYSSSFDENPINECYLFENKNGIVKGDKLIDHKFDCKIIK